MYLLLQTLHFYLLLSNNEEEKEKECAGCFIQTSNRAQGLHCY
uniref:Uncharacterized protein n=1 Tax=Lepeophtheirus salmonis TaxID=72036 RepID=A0A0K2V1L9_LEPSM